MKTIFRALVTILLTLVLLTFYWVSLPGNNEQRHKLAAKHQILIYNKVSKSGSTALVTLLKQISKRYGNNFTVSQHPGALAYETFKKKLSKEKLAQESRIIADLPRPVVYARHVYYIDLFEYGLEKPMYINLIRDPVERFVSNFYYRQFGSFGQNRSSPNHIENINDCVLQQSPRCTDSFYMRLYMTRYFCGQDSACGEDERQTIEMAKRNIEKDYIFIGLTEEFENSLILFEKILPRFFSGSLETWHTPTFHNDLRRYETAQKERISPEARRKLEEQMWADYEIYRFVQERFQKAKRLYGIL